MVHCPPVPTSPWMICSDRPQFRVIVRPTLVPLPYQPWRRLSMSRVAVTLRFEDGNEVLMTKMFTKLNVVHDLLSFPNVLDTSVYL